MSSYFFPFSDGIEWIPTGKPVKLCPAGYWNPISRRLLFDETSFLGFLPILDKRE
jgi:hypothetical protein